MSVGCTSQSRRWWDGTVCLVAMPGILHPITSSPAPVCGPIELVDVHCVVQTVATSSLWIEGSCVFSCQSLGRISLTEFEVLVQWWQHVYPKAGKFVNLHFPWIYIFARIYIPNLRKLKGKCKFYIFPKNVVFRWKIQDFCKNKNFPIFLKTKNYYFFPYPCSAPWTFQVWWQSCYPGPFSLLWNIKYTSLSSYKHTGTNQSSWVTLTTHRYMQKSQVHACQITSAQVQIKFQEHFKHCDNSQVHAKVSSIHACQIRSTPVQIKLHEKIYTSQVYIHDLFHRYKLIVNGSQEVWFVIGFLIVLMEPQSLSVYILSGLVLETCTSELAVHVHLKIVRLYLWS